TRREIVLGAARMADVQQLAMKVLAQSADGLAAPSHLARRGFGDAAQQAQQARLAAAVAALHPQRLTCADLDIDAAEQFAIAAQAGELRGSQGHCRLRLPLNASHSIERVAAYQRMKSRIGMPRATALIASTTPTAIVSATMKASGPPASADSPASTSFHPVTIGFTRLSFLKRR